MDRAAASNFPTDHIFDSKPSRLLHTAHQLTSQCFIRPPNFWLRGCKSARLLYVRSWRQPVWVCRRLSGTQPWLAWHFCPSEWSPFPLLIEFGVVIVSLLWTLVSKWSWKTRLFPCPIMRELAALRGFHDCVAQTWPICFQREEFNPRLLSLLLLFVRIICKHLHDL